MITAIRKENEAIKQENQEIRAKVEKAEAEKDEIKKASLIEQLKAQNIATDHLEDRPLSHVQVVAETVLANPDFTVLRHTGQAKTIDDKTRKMQAGTFNHDTGEWE